MRSHRTILNVLGTASAIGCAACGYAAVFGSLWAANTDAFQLYVLRPTMFLLGTVGTVVCLYFGPLYRTRAARVWRSWRENCEYERLMDDTYGWPPEMHRTNWLDDLRHLRYLATRCMVGRHEPSAVFQCPGGEEGPRGAYCADCGLRVGPYQRPTLDQSVRNIWDGKEG